MNPITLDIETVAIDDVSTYLVEPVNAPDNWKDPVKIAAYIAEAKAKQLEQAALDIDLAQVIALGIKDGDKPTQVLTAEHFPEREMLGELWSIWNHYTRTGTPMLVTYNGVSYDVPLLLRRSMYLDVKAPKISCDKYRHSSQQIDLMAILSLNGSKKYRGLQFYLARLGYPHGGTDITGADIAKAYADKDWAAIAQHCRMDVEATAWLAERIGAVPKRQPVTEAAGAF